MSESASSTQTQSSPLYKLPTEVRLMIWEYCYGELNIEILECSRRLGYKRRFSGMARIFAHYREVNPVLPPGHEPGDTLAPRQHASQLLLPLAKVSRLISEEALRVLYSRAQLRFGFVDGLVYFLNTVPPKHLRLIRTVRLQWCIIPPPVRARYKWTIVPLGASPAQDVGLLVEACGRLKDLSGLRQLDVIITSLRTPWSQGEAHVEQITGLEELCKRVQVRVKVAETDLSRVTEMFKTRSFQVIETTARDEF